LELSSPNNTEPLKKTIYDTTFFVDDVQINVVMEIINSTTVPNDETPNVQIFIDCITFGKAELSEKTIKEYFNKIFDLTKKMGFEL